MKKHILLLCCSLAMSAFAEREVELHTEVRKVDGKDATFWAPDKIEVTQGEKIKLVAHHNLPAGFDFHGLLIPALKLSETVNRNKEFSKEITIPASLKAGEYDVKCQFHAAHVGAKLIVKQK